MEIFKGQDIPVKINELLNSIYTDDSLTENAQNYCLRYIERLLKLSKEEILASTDIYIPNEKYIYILNQVLEYKFGEEYAEIAAILFLNHRNKTKSTI